MPSEPDLTPELREFVRGGEMPPGWDGRFRNGRNAARALALHEEREALEEHYKRDVANLELDSYKREWAARQLSILYRHRERMAEKEKARLERVARQKKKLEAQEKRLAAAEQRRRGVGPGSDVSPVRLRLPK